MSGLFECFHCGARQVVWDCDFDASDYGYDEPGIVHDLHCMSCGAMIQYVVLEEEDEENEHGELRSERELH